MSEERADEDKKPKKRAKPAGPSYQALTLGAEIDAAAEVSAEPSQVSELVAAPPKRPKRAAPAEAGAGIRERSKSYVLYLHPTGHKALRQYGLDADRPMQDLVIEALEQWAKSHGITAPIRPPEG